MSLELALQENTAAMTALTAALAAANLGAAAYGAVAAPAAEPVVEPKAEKPAAAAKAPKAAKAAPVAPEKPAPASVHTREEMQAALSKLKEEQGAPAAKGIIKDVGGVDKMADIGEDKIDAVYDAATAALEADDDGM